MIVVADSSPLRYLIVLGQQHLLPAIFGEVWIPSAVLDELQAAATPAPVRQFLADPPGWLKLRNPEADALGAIAPDLGAGERAALALACQLHADLILLDDAAGRREAVSLGIRMTGTVGVLRLAAERGLVDVPVMVAQLRQSGFYLSESLIHDAFGRWI
jgi:predicted nucleic acid-binding protein